eukprot:TRINITY_DN345_c1_g2_i2.p1 TRINITY_DN345_c1_g2~~TRINITY_DN345_c1_g2_i2.p1  ORF type:complete len:185 (-),score=67.57 TRINITY_DN345_c1_g2_i2:70-624(-)
MVWPVIKIFSLVMKSAAKPIAKKIKTYSVAHLKFRTLCIGMARTWHKVEGKMMVWSGDTSRSTRELNEAKAVDLAAEILSEAFLLLVGIVLLIYETNKSKVKESKKETALEKRLSNMEDTIINLQNQIKKLEGYHPEILPSEFYIKAEVQKDQGILNKMYSAVFIAPQPTQSTQSTQSINDTNK